MSIKEVLDRTTYRGEVTRNRTRKRDRWGQHRQADRPEGDLLRRSMPDLRIVSDDTWEGARARLGRIRAHLHVATKGNFGRRNSDAESRYLLPGFARCAVCGGSLCVMSRDSGKVRQFVYGCAANHKRGKSVCENLLVVRMENVDRAVLARLAADVLRPAVVDAVIAGVLEALRPKRKQAEASRLRAKLERVERALKRLATAIARAVPYRRCSRQFRSGTRTETS